MGKAFPISMRKAFPISMGKASPGGEQVITFHDWRWRKALHLLRCLSERSENLVCFWLGAKKVCTGVKNHSTPPHVSSGSPLIMRCGSNRVRRQSGFPTFISCQRQDPNVLPKRRQSHQGDNLCDVSTVPLVARWPVFLARGSDADGEPHSTTAFEVYRRCFRTMICRL